MREEQGIGLMPGLQPASEDQNVVRDHLTTMRCKITHSHAKEMCILTAQCTE